MREWTDKHPYLFWILLAVTVVLAGVNAFSGLTVGGVYDWDEARHGVNAYEMIQSGDYLVQTYDGEVDYWNVKPPLSIWSVVLSYKLFGYNLLGLRFFSALCLPVIVLISMLFLKKYVGVVASVGTGILFAATGTRFHHLFKTGDPDALFLLFCLLTCICLYRGITGNGNYLIGVGLSTAFAFLSKAMHVAPLFFVIAYTLLLQRKHSNLSAKDYLLKLLLPMALPVFIWAVLRFSRDGLEFFKQMFLLDVFNRVVSAVENHTGGFGYYFVVLHNLMGGWVFWGVLLTVLFTIFLEITAEKNPPRDRAFLLVFLNMLVWPLLLFSLATTKLGWYAYPSLIGYYFLAGYALQRLVDIAAGDKNRKRGAMGILTAGSLLIGVGLCIPPFPDIHQLASTSSEDSIFMEIETRQFGGYRYYTVGSDGGETAISQSWLLHGIHQGLIHQKGGVADYHLDDGDTLLVIQYSGQESLDTFVEEQGPLNVIAQNGQYAILQ